jgi:PadR family transcriptional regulator, regulatory protein PadR
MPSVAILLISMYSFFMNLKGSLPTLILESLSRGPSHGYEIATGIKRRSEGVLDFKEGTLYPALHTLERDGMLTSYTEIENGRTRRYYQLTDKGSKTLAKSRLEWQRMSGAISGILSGVA